MTLGLLGCAPRATPTPSGTVLIDWENTSPTLANGLAIGATVGAPVRETRTVEIKPDEKEVRDRSLKPARIELTIEREDVAIVPNASGVRPADLAALPTHVVAKVTDNGGWRFEKASCEMPSWPIDIGEQKHRVGIFVRCQLPMSGGREDAETLFLTVAGNGKHSVMGGVGKASLL